MATKVTEASLTCSICLRRFRKPRALPCLHSYCEDCLMEYAPSGTKIILCPMCQEKVKVPDGDVTKFKLDFRLQSQVEDANRYEKEAGIVTEMLTCNCCKDEGDAIAKCEECEQILCKFGMKAHENLAGLRDHNVVLVKDDETSEEVTQTGKHISTTARNRETCPMEKRAILISNMPHLEYPPERVRDRLTIHFQKKSNAGGDVDGVLYPLEGCPRNAVVIFTERQPYESTLKREHYLEDFTTKVSVEPFPQVFKEVEADVNAFYWNLVPRLETKRLIDVLSNMCGKSNLKLSKHILTKVICTTNQLEDVHSAIVDAVGLVHSSGASQSVIDCGIFVTSIPFLTNDSEQLKEELRKHFEVDGISQLESLMCPIKGNAQETVALFKSTKDREGYIRNRDKCFFGETLCITNLPPIFQQIKARLEDFFVTLVESYGMESFRQKLQSICGTSLIISGTELTGDSEQMTKAVAAILEIIGLSRDNLVQTQFPKQENDLSMEKDGDQYHVGQLEIGSTFPVFILMKARIDDMYIKHVSPEEVKQMSATMCEECGQGFQLSGNTITGTYDQIVQAMNIISKAFEIHKTTNQTSADRKEFNITERQETYVKATGEQFKISAGKIHDDMKEEEKEEYEPFVVDRCTFQHMMQIRSDRVEALEKAFGVNIEVDETLEKISQTVRIRPKTVGKQKQKISPESMQKARDEFVTLYQEIFYSTKQMQINCEVLSSEAIARAIEGTKQKYKHVTITNYTCRK